MENQNNQEQNNQNNKKNKKKGTILWIYVAILAGILLLNFVDFGPGPIEIKNYEKIEKVLKKGYISKIDVVNRDYAEIYINPTYLDSVKLITKEEKIKEKGPQFKFQFITPENFEKKIDDINNSLPKNNQIYISSVKKKDYFSEILSWIIPLAILVFIWIFMFRRIGGGGGGGSNVFSIGKSKAKLFEGSKMKVTFNDVAGLEEAKQEIVEIVDFLKTPQKFTKLGGKIPKGVLLVGPPGTGKTLLAKAVAGEASVPFFSLSGSDFVEMFVGVGASRVRDLFAQAKSKAPCIIFIDEIDAIGRMRSKKASFNSNDERENTLNQLLTEMDGFDTNTGVILLAATNRADILDTALLRAGRFDRQIMLDLPDVQEREAIFKVHTKDLTISLKLNMNLLAKQTPGFSGADIANACNEAALIAARKNKETIEQDDFNDAIDKIIGGLEKKSKIIKPDEKKRIAFHESGHATVSWLLKYAQPLIKVSIVPRGKALGAAWYLPEERQLSTKEQFLDEVCALLGGRAAEEVSFTDVSSGALNDLERATKQVYAMVAYFGMSNKLPNVSYYDSMGQEYNFTKPFSEKTAETIDEEVREIINVQFKRAKKIILDNFDKFKMLSEKLIEKEVIYSDDVEIILGQREFEQSTREVMDSVKLMKKENKEELKSENKEENDKPEIR